MPRPLRIALFIGRFPVVSETFILRQVASLLDLGHEVDPKTGKPQIDDKNANPSLAKRPIIGINIFSSMKSVANNKWSGTIYNADDGRSYSSSVTVAGARKLEVRGCVMGILCGGETWIKIGEVTVADAAN